MSIQSSAEIEVLLEGVALPATEQELVEYARREDEQAAEALEDIPDREYRSLDEVGEALASVQPAGHGRATNLPHEKGGSYVDAHADPGAA